MVKDNKTCILCGKKYSYCSGCSEFDHLPRWMGCYCSENCKDVFNILSGYNMKHKTKEEAKSLLEKCDLTKTESYSDFNKACINTIMENEGEPKETIIKNVVNTVSEKTEDKPIIDTDDIKTDHNELFINDPVISSVSGKPKRMKYANKRSN